MKTETPVRKAVRKMRTVEASEAATGCCQNPHGLGKLYADDDPTGRVLTVAEALDWLMEGHGVEVPNAGAGSYDAFFTGLGFKEAEALETSSSAGDWTLAVLDNGVWYVAFQSHRYPYHGYRYSINREVCASTLEELSAIVFAG